MRPNDFEIFADMLDILAMAPLHDVKPASGARIDLNAHDLSHRRRKQPFTCDPRIKPCIEDTLRRSPESATDAGIDTLRSKPMEIVILFRPPARTAGVHLH
jgi:hypothetical protein